MTVVEIQNKSRVRKNQPLVYTVYSVTINRNRCKNVIWFWKQAIAWLVLSASLGFKVFQSKLPAPSNPLTFTLPLHVGDALRRFQAAALLVFEVSRAITLLVLSQPGFGSTPCMYLSRMICSAALGAERLFVSIHSCANGAGSLIAQLVLAE